jgi:hypothetical protein
MGTLLFTLLACSPWDGSWLLFLEVAESPVESEVGRDMSGVAEFHELADGGFAADFGGLTLVGTVEGDEVSLDFEAGYTYSGPSCDESTSRTTSSLDGTLSSETGFVGELRLVQSQETKACGGNDSESSVTLYDVTGVRMQANDGAHAGDEINWGG